MAKYQASVGLKMYMAATYAMTSSTEIDGVTDTPDKGGAPNDITVNIISQKMVTHMNGQQDIGQMEYTFVPDFTASTGNVAVLLSAIGTEKWFYEEYEEGTWSSATPPVYQLGKGVLYKGKITDVVIGGQSGNNAQSARFYVQLSDNKLYESSGGASPTYTDLSDGKSVTLS